MRRRLENLRHRGNYGGNHETPSAAEGRNQSDEIRQMTADFADTRGCAIDPRGVYPRVSAKSAVLHSIHRLKNLRGTQRNKLLVLRTTRKRNVEPRKDINVRGTRKKTFNRKGHTKKVSRAKQICSWIESAAHGFQPQLASFVSLVCFMVLSVISVKSVVQKINRKIEDKKI